MEIKVRRLREEAVLPSRGSKMAAGADLCACVPGAVTIRPNETAFLTTGIAMEIPEGYVGLVFARSGLACREGLAPANKVGVIDADYRGEIVVALRNQSDRAATVEPGDRIAQIVIVPCLAATFAFSEELADTGRGSGGFGSTGR